MIKQGYGVGIAGGEMNQAVKEKVGSLGIKFLVHFTRAVNLPSMLVDGIIPRANVLASNPAALHNDEHRYDNRREGTCISIAHPNGPMLYKYRKENPDTAWVVLALSPSILWEKRCAYCKYNAATAEMRDTPFAELSTIKAFDTMYDDVAGDNSRAAQKLKTFDPTDKQAEVMVFDVIEPKYILGAAFQTQAVMNQYRPIFGTRKLVLHPGDKGLFASRGYARMYA